jgi:hypothetical protein
VTIISKAKINVLTAVDHCVLLTLVVMNCFIFVLYAVTVNVSQEELLSHIDVYAADHEAVQEREPMLLQNGTLYPPP